MTIGSLVVLRSGGPLMTVWEINDGLCSCEWFDGCFVSKETFSEDELTELVRADSRP